MLKELPPEISSLFSSLELTKVRAFSELVANTGLFEVQPTYLLELCCGHGLLGFWWIYSGLVQESVLIDKKETRRLTKILRISEQREINCRFMNNDLLQESFDWTRYESDKTRILAVHACGELSDRIIDISLSSGIPFALVTCCHKRATNRRVYTLKNPPDPRLMNYERYADYLDCLRKQYLREKGWTARLEHLPRNISPENNV